MTTATLKNGATIIAMGDGVVLAKNEGTVQEFVTWRIDQDGNTHSGHYFTFIGDAVRDYAARGGKVGAE